MGIRSTFRRVRATVVRALLAIASALGIYTAVQAQAPIYTVTATMPTEYVGGAALPLDHLATWTISYSLNGGALQTKVVPVTAANMSTTIPKAIGTTCVQVFVTTKGAAPVPTDSRNSSSGMVPEPPICVQFNGGPKSPSNTAVQ